MEHLAGLPEEARKLALERFQMLRPHLEEKRSLRLVAAEADVPFRTAQRWVAQYQRFGLAALIRRKPTVNGERRAVSEAIRKAIEGLALQVPPLPIVTLYRQVQQLVEKLGEALPVASRIMNKVQSPFLVRTAQRNQRLGVPAQPLPHYAAQAKAGLLIQPVNPFGIELGWLLIPFTGNAQQHMQPSIAKLRPL